MLLGSGDRSNNEYYGPRTSEPNSVFRNRGLGVLACLPSHLGLALCPAVVGGGGGGGSVSRDGTKS